MNPLKNKRQELKMTQKEMALRLGYSLKTIEGYERGIRFPPIDKLMKIARAYQMTNEELIEYIEYCEEKEK